MILNLIYNGVSHSHALDGLEGVDDAMIKRIAAEVNLLQEGALDNFVVDRVNETIYVRPKVPFGAFDLYYL